MMTTLPGVDGHAYFVCFEVSGMFEDYASDHQTVSQILLAQPDGLALHVQTGTIEAPVTLGTLTYYGDPNDSVATITSGDLICGSIEYAQPAEGDWLEYEVSVPS